MNTYTVSQFAEMTGYAVKTLQRWDREKRLVPLRTLTNRRMYTDEHLRLLRGMPHKDEHRDTIVYMRVSSQAQRPDLKNQRLALEQFCLARGIEVDQWVEEIGGGLNFKRRKFLEIVDGIVAGRVERLVIAHQDRLTRFGFELVGHLAQAQGAEIVVLNTESLSPDQEMVQDLMTITHCFSARLDGLRNYRKALKKAISDDQGA
jgi:predicted site-specific integrase-resolvase